MASLCISMSAFQASVRRSIRPCVGEERRVCEGEGERVGRIEIGRGWGGEEITEGCESVTVRGWGGEEIIEEIIDNK